MTSFRDQILRLNPRRATPRGRPILFVHIPKTAGSSLRRSIEDNYKPSQCLFAGGTDLVNQLREGHLPGPAPKVLHGHLQPTPALCAAMGDPLLVVWVRNPIDRLLSLYHYWLSLPPSANPLQRWLLDDRPPPDEFAKHHEIRYEMFPYFADVPIEEYDFVGITEHYQRDLGRLGAMLDWKHVDVHRDNIGARREEDEGLRQRLGEILSESMEIYDRALAIRQERIAKTL